MSFPVPVGAEYSQFADAFVNRRFELGGGGGGGGGGAVTETVADAVEDGLAWLAAVTVQVPALFPAVY